MGLLFAITNSYEMKQMSMPTIAEALPGRAQEMEISGIHFVNGRSFKQNIPEQMNRAVFGMGCFWGAERLFWSLNGVYSTAVGYVAGITPNPEYQEVCTGMTGHNEVVLVIYDPTIISYTELLTVFWESHDPTQGMRQGNDRGTQYRSGIYTFTDDQAQQAEHSKGKFQQSLTSIGLGDITTEIIPIAEFYFAEEYHQQYLAKNPDGYCGISGTGARLSVE